jgi:uncharacterized YigZ family protein
MAAVSAYLTIARDGDAEIEVKRSRFLCWLRRVDDEDQAREVVQRARRQHWDARHHCSAYVLGPEARVQRSNDDGEPTGTAGAPMLDVLRGREVSDVVAVVIRWFGGTLLGAGGLVRAYSDAVRTCLDDVGVVRRRQVHLVDVTTGHAEAARLEHDLRARGLEVREVTFAEQATLRLAVPGDDVADLEALLGRVTGGTARLREAGTAWADVAAPGS